MTHHDPIDALRAENPVPHETLAGLATADERAAVRSRALARATPPRPRLRPALAFPGLGLAAAVALTVIILVGGGSGSRPAYAAAAVQAAEANPRLLISAPGWSVSGADERPTGDGQMTFTNGPDKIDLSWIRLPDATTTSWPPPPGHTLNQWYRLDAVHCLTPLVAGSTVTPSKPVDCTTYTRLTEQAVPGYGTGMLSETLTDGATPTRISLLQLRLPPDHGTLLTIDASGVDHDAFVTAIGSLHNVDVDTWLAALPPGTIKPIERPEVVDEMLRGVPIPASVDVAALKGLPEASSRYQLGAAVTGAVACGWLDQWATAKKTGDDTGAAQAVDAMATARNWPILEEMRPQGGWSQTIWEYASAMRRDDREKLLGPSGTETLPDGRVYELRPGYAAGLGCDSEQRILRPGRAEPRQLPGGPGTPVAAPPNG